MMWWGMGTVVAMVLPAVLFSRLKIRMVYRKKRLTVRLIYACFSVALWPRPAKKQKPPKSGSVPETAKEKSRLSKADLRFLIRLLRRLPSFLHKHLPSLSLSVHECRLRIGAREADKTAYLTLAADALLGSALRMCDRLFPKTDVAFCGVFADYLTPGFSAAADIEVSVRGIELVTMAVWLWRRISPRRPAVGRAKPALA